MKVQLIRPNLDYSDYNPTNDRSSRNPFVRMLSTMNPATMWNEFQTKRAAMPAQLPPIA